MTGNPQPYADVEAVYAPQREHFLDCLARDYRRRERHEQRAMWKAWQRDQHPDWLADMRARIERVRLEAEAKHDARIAAAREALG